MTFAPGIGANDEATTTCRCSCQSISGIFSSKERVRAALRLQEALSWQESMIKMRKSRARGGRHVRQASRAKPERGALTSARVLEDVVVVCVKASFIG